MAQTNSKIRRLTAVVAAALVIGIPALLAGCSRAAFDPTATLANPAVTASELYKVGAVSQELTEIDPEFGFEYYLLDADDFTEARFFFSDGATAEEFTVLTAKDDAAFAEAQTRAQTRIDSQIRSFEDYVPTEVPKLRNALVLTDTTTRSVVLCVASDYDAARRVLNLS